MCRFSGCSLIEERMGPFQTTEKCELVKETSRAYWLLRPCINRRSGKFNHINCGHPSWLTRRSGTPNLGHLLVFLNVFTLPFKPLFLPFGITMKERRNTQPSVVRCKLVLVGDVQCGKTAMLQVLAKDCYPEVCVLILMYL